MKNAVLVIILGVIAFCGGLYFLSPEFRANHLPEERSTGQAQIGGSFTLTDQNGNQRTDKEFRGKHMLVFFGFTSCPNICPVGLATMTQAMEQLGDDAKEIVPIFITVDPGKDTPAHIKDFLTNFHPSMVGLTGTAEQLKAAESAYKVYAVKNEDKATPDGYTMDHSGYVYLMDEKGKYLTHFSYDAAPEEMAKKIKELL